MAKLSSYKLCPGTFFSILCTAKKVASNSDININEVNMMLDLVKLGDPDASVRNVSRPETDVAKVKSCSRDSASWMGFNKPNYILKYKTRYEDSYNELVKQMNQFIKDYLDNETIVIERMCQSLLDLVYNDKSIVDSTTFDVGPNGDPIKKSDLLKCEKYDVQFFLLGIWTCIICRTEIRNSEGRDTITSLSDFQVKHPGQLYPFEEGTSILKIQFETLSSKKLASVNRPATPKEEYIPDYLNNYLTGLREDFANIKPLFFNKPFPFYNLFVHSDLISKSSINGQKTIIKSPTPSSIRSDFGNYIIFSGKGGLGKSMMMNHFVLDSIDNFKANKMIPFFIPLKDYTSEKKDFLIFANDNMYASGLFEYEDFRRILSEGRALLLLDGLDEIKSSYKEMFQRTLDQFVDKYPNNMFIISSRGDDCFESYTRFTELTLSPLSLEQSVELISKIEYDPEIKNNFIEELKSKLYVEHNEFASNPMMLTILFMTYDSYGVREKQHLFFSDAYEVLAFRHDAHKKGFKRLYHTGLPADRFKEYLSLFAASLFVDEKVDFTKDELANIINEIKANIDPDNKERVTASDFFNDLDESLCLLKKTGDKYEFSNPAFKNYFVAYHFSKRRDEDLGGLIPYLTKKKNAQVLEMLYEMRTEQVCDYIILPYLKGVFDEASNDEDGFKWGFVKIVYPVLRYSKGDCWNWETTESPSYLYTFIRKLAGIDYELNVAEFTDEEEEKDFITNYVYHPISMPVEARIPAKEIEYDERIKDKPVAAGYDVEIDTAYLLMNKDKYAALIASIEDDWQGVGDELETIHKYFEDLNNKKASRPAGRNKLLF